jgi:MFS family permease
MLMLPSVLTITGWPLALLRPCRYDIGATSGALVSMTSQQFSGTDWYGLSAFQSGLVVSLSLAGALLGSGAALLYGDKLGRRNELLAASVLYGEPLSLLLFILLRLLLCLLLC